MGPSNPALQQNPMAALLSLTVFFHAPSQRGGEDENEEHKCQQRKGVGADVYNLADCLFGQQERRKKANPNKMRYNRRTA